jgi:hypothetical protein
MLLNNGGSRFLDAEFLLGIEPRLGGRTHTPWFDLDCLQEGMGTDLCRGRSGTIRVMAPLGSRSAAIFDIDNDGDLDIVTNDFNSAPQVLVSNLAQHPDPLAAGGAGGTSSRNGLGATSARTPASTCIRIPRRKSGYLSQARRRSISGRDAERSTASR